jgi:hypothetical protein
VTSQGNTKALSELDRPNSYIGKTVPRPNLDRLMQGRGLYVSDIELPGDPPKASPGGKAATRPAGGSGKP